MATVDNQTEFAFEHINLNQIDPGFKPVPENVYNLEVNSIKPSYVKVTKPGSKYEGQTVLVLKGSFTIVDDAEYSGRKLWSDFWATNNYNLIELKKLSEATGVIQGEGQTLPEFVEQFATMNPPAKFQCFVTKEDDYKGTPRNVVKFVQARAA